MIRVFGYNEMCEDFEFYVHTDEEFETFKKNNPLSVVFSDIEPEIDKIVKISEKVNIKFESGSNLNRFIDRVLDRLQGRNDYAEDMLYIFTWRQSKLCES